MLISVLFGLSFLHVLCLHNIHAGVLVPLLILCLQTQNATDCSSVCSHAFTPCSNKTSDWRVQAFELSGFTAHMFKVSVMSMHALPSK